MASAHVGYAKLDISNFTHKRSPPFVRLLKIKFVK